MPPGVTGIAPPAGRQASLTAEDKWAILERDKMNPKKRTSVLVLAVMMALTMTAPIVLGQDKGSSNGNERTIVGVWL
jgi:hypothetical protein